MYSFFPMDGSISLALSFLVGIIVHPSDSATLAFLDPT